MNQQDHEKHLMSIKWPIRKRRNRCTWGLLFPRASTSLLTQEMQLFSLAIFLCLIAVAFGVTNVAPLAGGGYEATNDFLRVEIGVPFVKVHVKLPTAGKYDERAFGSYIESWIDEIEYRVPTNDSGCDTLGSTFELSNWDITWSRGPGDAAVFVTRGYFGTDLSCDVRFTIYVPDSEVDMIVAGIAVRLVPWQVKYSLDVNCPWEYLVKRHLNLDLSTTGLALISRRSGPRLTISMETDTNNFADVMNPMQDIKDVKGPAETVWPSYEKWRDRRCDLSTAQLLQEGPPLLGLWPNFNFSNYAEFRIKFGSTAGLDAYIMLNQYQAWTYSDRLNFTNMGVFLKQEEIFMYPPQTLSSGLILYRLPLTMQFRFINNASYDPTISFLFGDYENSPMMSPAQLAELASTLAVNVGVGVSVAAVILVAIIALSIIIMKNQRARHVLLPFSKRADDIAELPRGSDLDLDKDGSDHAGANGNGSTKQGGWVSARAATTEAP